ncbi:hypothetical protein L208DRAFT_1316284 [Tricholoma matsutake]|nr:hypothetical protein L208DRAFT_1316284 [Tricholoma matsutake 945]
MQNNGDEITTPCVLGIQVKPKAKHYQNSDHPLLTWISYCEVYLDGHLCLEGRGLFQGLGCIVCGEGDLSFRC